MLQEVYLYICKRSNQCSREKEDHFWGFAKQYSILKCTYLWYLHLSLSSTIYLFTDIWKKKAYWKILRFFKQATNKWPVFQTLQTLTFSLEIKIFTGPKILNLYCHAKNSTLPTCRLTSIWEVCPYFNMQNYKGTLIRDSHKTQNLSFCFDPNHSSRPTLMNWKHGTRPYEFLFCHGLLNYSISQKLSTRLEALESNLTKVFGLASKYTFSLLHASNLQPCW